MTAKLSCCGLDCSTCSPYLATQAHDEEAIARVVQEWSQAYHRNFTPDDIRCDGCSSTSGLHFCECAHCDVRTCVLEHGLANCGECDAYPCERITRFIDMVPKVKATLDAIHAAH